MKPPTIKDIAEILGISVATVSRALTNSHEVNPQTREKVLETAKRMKYKPNLLARNLKKNSNRLIGVIVPEIITFYFPELIIGIQEIFNPLGYQVLICQSGESSAQERKNVEMLENQQVEGLIVSVSKESKNIDLYKRLLDDGMPIVFTNRVIEEIDAPKVVIDDKQWAYNATEMIIKHGYRRIAHLAGNLNLTITKLRLEGYRQALKDYDIPIDERLIMYVGIQQEQAKIGVRYLLSLKERPDAVFCVNDPIAIGTMLELRDKGIRVPEDMAIVGFTESPTGKVLGLSSVAQPTFEMGRTAATMLLNRIQNPMLENIETIVLDAKLIVRKNTLIKKVANPDISL
ncbi:LacI family transcriptional regulator [Bacteroides sp. 51]|nr:LacI family transcriptional regulator [Bacteroides sp. 51]